MTVNSNTAPLSGVEPVRYHLMDEAPFIMRTAEGEQKLGAGWLVISEAEYATLARSRPQDDTSQREGEEPFNVAAAAEAVRDVRAWLDSPSGPVEADPVERGEAVDVTELLSESYLAMQSIMRVVEGAPDTSAALQACAKARAAIEHYTAALAHPAPASPAGTDAKRIAEPCPDDELYFRQGIEILAKEAERTFGSGKIVNAIRALTDKSGNAELIEAGGKALYMFDYPFAGQPQQTKSWEDLGPGFHQDKYRAKASAVIAALRSPTPDRMETWQPIDTAPKDGSWFLGYDETRQAVEDRFDVWHWDKNAEEAGFWINAADSNLDCFPSHWQPLAPPASLNKEEGK